MIRKHWVWKILLTMLVCIWCCSAALAENHVESINIEVELQKDGSAVITQTWYGNFNEGTECYLPILDSGYLTVRDLSAACDSTEYESLSDWDVRADFDEKAYRCGIRRTDGGYELCWGISEYGRHEYRISYVVDPLVCSYDGADGFNYMFVNPEMNITPTDVSVHLYSPDTALTESNASAWAFGFEGQVRFESDGIYVWTDSARPVGNEDYVVIMLKLDKGMFDTTHDMGMSFNAALDKAMEGSSYRDEDKGALYAGIGICAVFGGLGIAVFLSSFFRKRALKKIQAKYADLYELPCEGNLAAIWRMGRLFGRITEEGSVIGALLMNLLRDECIVPMQTATSEENAKDMPLQMLHAPENNFSPEALLYNVLLEACDENGILEPKYVKHCFKKNPEVMRRMLTNIEEKENRFVVEKGYFQDKPSGSVKKLTEAGQREMAMMMNWQSVLRGDTTANAECFGKISPEECCALALLFGLKKEAVQGIRAYYPGYVQETYWNRWHHYYWYSMFYRDYSYGEMHRAEQRRSAGKGGSSSFGGGGGFSGGGHGGGTR